MGKPSDKRRHGRGGSFRRGRVWIRLARRRTTLIRLTEYIIVSICLCTSCFPLGRSLPNECVVGEEICSKHTRKKPSSGEEALRKERKPRVSFKEFFF